MPNLNPTPNPLASTEAQLDYIDSLFESLGIFNEVRKIAHASEIIERKLTQLSQLTKKEASICITQLKEWRDLKKDNQLGLPLEDE